jgi:hypothetical protein
MNNNILSYRGKVKLDTIKKGRIIHSEIHNTGLPDMCWMFSKAISGNLNSATDVPRLVDLGYVIPGTNGIWTSILNSPVNIGGRQFSYDSSLQNWVGTLISTIYYSDLNGAILDDVLAQTESVDNPIQLKLRLCSFNSSNRKYFAEVDMSPKEREQIRELTSVIVTWYSEIIPETGDTVNAGSIEDSNYYNTL